MKKVMSIVILVIAAVVIFMGVFAYIDTPEDYTAGYNVSSATFGADFYTYIYGAADEMVDAMSAANENIVEASIEDAKRDAMMMICVGLGILAFGLYCTGEAFGEKKKATVAVAPMSAPQYATPPVVPTQYATPPYAVPAQETQNPTTSA